MYNGMIELAFGYLKKGRIVSCFIMAGLGL